MEKNKALLLIHGIKQNSDFNTLPKHISDKFISFKKNILELENLNRESNSIEYSSQKDSLFQLKKQFELFKDSIYNKNPNLSSKTSEIKLTNLKTVQNNLDENTLVISYISNEENFRKKTLLAQLISSNNIYSFEIINYNNFEKNCNEFRDLISKPLKTENQFNNFKNVSYALYNYLLPNDSLKNLVEKRKI
ncbi:hypothetical protein [Tenacibaculum skagerrakense]|nr:hypothetical protein [Tenacibaculum skagerrakense]